MNNVAFKNALFFEDGCAKGQTYLLIPFEQFPFMKGVTIKLDWSQREDNMGGALTMPGISTQTKVYVTIHPFTFARMFAEMAGSIAGLDMLKIFLHDHIDNKFRIAKEFRETMRLYKETGNLIHTK